MICKDCIHYEVCVFWTGMGAYKMQMKNCIHFKNKSDIVELPCKVGDTVYVINKKEIYSCEVDGINIDYKSKWFTFLQNGTFAKFKDKVIYFLDDFNKTVFLTKEEAEQALETMGHGSLHI